MSPIVRFFASFCAPLFVTAILEPAHAAPLGCAEAAAVVERSLDIPQGLLAAIGRVESGNQPLAVNANGKSLHFERLDMASEAARLLSAGSVQGHRPAVDIGCFQIDLAWHPEAFASIRSGFDPVTNGIAAALFLQRLHTATGDWHQAVARYHAASREGWRYAFDVFQEYENPQSRDSGLRSRETPGHKRQWKACVHGSGVTVFVPGGACG